MLSAVTLFAVLQAKATLAEPKLLAKLASKVLLIGESGALDKHVATFLNLKKKEIKWHSKFDNERQVQVHLEGNVRILIFLVPEKPFPEFGKTWVYGVGTNGKLLKSGVCEPREKFREMIDSTANEKNARIEIAFWVKALEIS
jgi:hypothetical protein